MLGVNRGAKVSEINKAHRKAAKKYHPDKHPVSKRKAMEAKMAEVNNAYDVLQDPEKRRVYDQMGEEGLKRGGGGGLGALVAEAVEVVVVSVGEEGLISILGLVEGDLEVVNTNNISIISSSNNSKSSRDGNTRNISVNNPCISPKRVSRFW